MIFCKKQEIYLNFIISFYALYFYILQYIYACINIKAVHTNYSQEFKSIGSVIRIERREPKFKQ